MVATSPEGEHLPRRACSPPVFPSLLPLAARKDEPTRKERGAYPLSECSETARTMTATEEGESGPERLRAAA